MQSIRNNISLVSYFVNGGKFTNVKQPKNVDVFRWFSVSQNCKSSAYESTLPDTFYNEEQKEIQKTVKRLVETELNPHADDWEAKGRAPIHKIVKLFASHDLLGINKPVAYGGLGLNYKYHVAFVEELGAIHSYGSGAGVIIHTDMSIPALANFGSDELKKEFLLPSIQGDVVACIGVSEPAAGSDVAGLKCTAKRVGDDLVINGEKTWISNGMQADWMCLLASTSQGSPHKNKSLICVPLNSKGVTRHEIHKIGLKTNDWGQIFFDDVRVPVKNIIGQEGSGFIYQMLQFQEERLSMAIGTLRACDSIIALTIDYTRQRKAFNKSILDNQIVHYRLAELATEVEALRALTYQTVDRYTAGRDVTLLASMIKLKSGRLLRELSDSCLQFWGAMGYSQEARMSRYFRDARQASIAGGTDEIMLSIICKYMNIFPAGGK